MARLARIVDAVVLNSGEAGVASPVGFGGVKEGNSPFYSMVQQLPRSVLIDLAAEGSASQTDSADSEVRLS